MVKGVLLSSDVQVIHDGERLRCVVPVLVTESPPEDRVREDGILLAEVLNLEQSLRRGDIVDVWVDTRSSDKQIYSQLHAATSTGLDPGVFLPEDRHDGVIHIYVVHEQVREAIESWLQTQGSELGRMPSPDREVPAFCIVPKGTED